MSKRLRESMVNMLAERMLKMREVVDGLTLLHGGPLMTVPEICDIAREALDLIEEGKV